jgi:hypothetical protein
VTDWRTLAACLDEDPDAFFPDPTDTPAITYAKSICTGCPVQITCLETAIREEAGRGLSFRAGIRGGKTPAQRVREYWRRARDRAAHRAPAPPVVVDPPKPKPKSDRKRPTFIGDRTRATIARRRLAGEGATALAREYDITTKTVQRIARAAERATAEQQAAA